MGNAALQIGGNNCIANLLEQRSLKAKLIKLCLLLLLNRFQMCLKVTTLSFRRQKYLLQLIKCIIIAAILAQVGDGTQTPILAIKVFYVFTAFHDAKLIPYCV